MNRNDPIAYLLHEMSEAERTAFAERWFTEPELYERLRMAEAGLLDDYARGKLSGRQRRQVERFLLESEAQRRKLEFAEALRVVFPSSDRFRVRWAFVAAAVLLVSTGLSVWLGVENLKLQKEVSRLEPARHLERGEIYTLGLSSDILRGASPEFPLRLPPSVRLLRLELELKPGEETSIYSVSVSADGRIVWTEGPLQPEPQGADHLAVVWIPAGILSTGDYTVQLDAHGNPVAYYRFALRR
jgi:hypothetical protein